MSRTNHARPARDGRRADDRVKLIARRARHLKRNVLSKHEAKLIDDLATVLESEE